MAFVADRVIHGMRPNVAQLFRNAVTQFEADVGAPVRVLEPGDGREPAQHLRRWSGTSGSMEHYPGHTEEDRNERGITILSHSWNSTIDTGGWRYINAPAEIIDEWRPRYREEARPEIQFEVYGPNADQITSAGGEPMVYPGTNSVWGELYEQRLLFIHINLAYIDNYGTADWNWWFMDALRENADPELRAAAAARRQEEQRTVFAQMMQEQGDNALRELRERSAVLGSDMGRMQQELANTESQFRTVGRQLDVLLADDPEVTQEAINAEWEAILNHSRVRSVRLGTERGELPDGSEGDLPYMIVESDDLWITVPELQQGRRRYNERTAEIEGRHMPLGQFSIKLNFGNTTTHIRNNTMRMENRWDHPHVSEGELCTGDFGRTMVNMLQRRQLAPMVSMIFQILNVTTLHDEWGGRNILLWAEADDQLRRDNGWPAWQSGEERHPLLVQQDQEQEARDS